MLPLNYQPADGSAGQVIKTDGSGALSFTNVSTSVNPATSLASSTDCGNLTQETNDAFGQIISDTVTVLNLLVDPTDALGTVDQGAPFHRRTLNAYTITISTRNNVTK